MGWLSDYAANKAIEVDMSKHGKHKPRKAKPGSRGDKGKPGKRK